MKRNSLPGAGVQADDYSEESFADEQTPWEEVAEEEAEEEGYYLEEFEEEEEAPESYYSKGSPAWEFYSEDVKAAAEEIGRERYGDPALQGEWDFSIREQLADAWRNVTYQMIIGGGLKTMIRLSDEAGASDEKAGHCHGYANCCKCRVCTRRANGWGRWGDAPPDSVVIRDMIERVLDKDPNRDPRGGSRRRGEQRAFRIGHISGRHRYDFTRRESGPGKAGADERAIEEWLTGKIVRGKNGRLWLTEEKIRNVSDYKRVLRPGRKSKEQTRLYVGLLRRVSTLVEDGASAGIDPQGAGRQEGHDPKSARRREAAQTAPVSHFRSCP